MRIKERMRVDGKVRVVVIRSDGSREVHMVDNLVTNAGVNLHRDSLVDEIDCRIKYVALGASNAAPNLADTQLGDERIRRPITIQTVGAPGVLTTTAYIQANEANDFVIEEIGFFAGNATGAPNSGTLYSRVLYNRDKDADESLQIEREGTIGGV